MKKIFYIILSVAIIIMMSFVTFAKTKTVIYAKLMSFDWENWIWQELPNVISYQKTSDGLQYVIKYKEIPDITNTYTEERMVTMTTGVDNIMIVESETVDY